MPLSVTVENLQSETWPKELRIQVKNTSSKPIYFVLAFLIFPDDPAPTGVSGIHMTYGKFGNGEIGKEVPLEEEHLGPGDSYVFEIDEVFKKGLEAKYNRTPERFRKMEFHFEIINFGDGTGFEAGRSLDLRGKKIKPPA
jgi:hypothetical protein